MPTILTMVITCIANIIIHDQKPCMYHQHYSVEDMEDKK